MSLWVSVSELLIGNRMNRWVRRLRFVRVVPRQVMLDTNSIREDRTFLSAEDRALQHESRVDAIATGTIDHAGEAVEIQPFMSRRFNYLILVHCDHLRGCYRSPKNISSATRARVIPKSRFFAASGSRDKTK